MCGGKLEEAAAAVKVTEISKNKNKLDHDTLQGMSDPQAKQRPLKKYVKNA